MKAAILDGGGANDATGKRIRDIIFSEMENRGWETEYINTGEQKIGNCAGDFFCWIRYPGMCHIDDDNRKVARAIVNCDLMVYLTPVTFGGYSSSLKRTVDHLIQNISPNFCSIDGETHHRKRYSKYPDFLVLGWEDSPDERSRAVFRHLVMRNAINFYAEKAACGLFDGSLPDSGITGIIKDCLSGMDSGQTMGGVALPENSITDLAGGNVRRAVLLVGSPRLRSSTSHVLGEYLSGQLERHSVATEAVYLYETARSAEKMRAMLEAVDRADLVALAFPLYVDSLPGPVTEVLERIAAHRRDRIQNKKPLFAAVANCGFPEAVHNNTALEICGVFAEQAGFVWAGGLALGGGHGLGEKPLEEWGARTAKIRSALDIAAAELALGRAVPAEAKELMSSPLNPAWAVRMFGGFAWKQQAKQYGMQKLLESRPYKD